MDGADVLFPPLRAKTVIANQGFDAEASVLEPLRRMGKPAVIPTRAKRRQPRAYDKELYKARHLIEKLLRKTQALLRYRHAIRQNQTELPRRNPTRLRLYLANAYIWLI